MKPKHIFPLLIALLISSTIFAQSTDSISTNDKKKFVILEKMPEFPGGEQGIINFLKQNIKYPPEAMMAESQGRVLVRFMVNENGEAVKPEIMIHASPELDREALRLVSIMPKWKPGQLNGDNVSVWFILPIIFKLPDANSLLYNTESIVDKIISDINKSVIVADFSLEDAKNNKHITSGRFIIQKGKIMIETPEKKIWFDRKTMWTYFPQTNEVNITKPKKRELEDINFLLLIKRLNKSRERLPSIPTDKELKVTYVIANYENVELTIDKVTYSPTKIVYSEKNGNRTQFNISNYKTATNIDNSVFTFNKTNYKGVYVNDLR